MAVFFTYLLLFTTSRLFLSYARFSRGICALATYRIRVQLSSKENNVVNLLSFLHNNSQSWLLVMMMMIRVAIHINDLAE